MNSLVAFGARTPTFGRTEYFLGEVVLTWKHTKTISLNSEQTLYAKNWKKCDDTLKATWW